jgi:hypothetical protein
MKIIIILFLFPQQGLAVEYSITNVQIDAYLQENRDVEVKETHTYSFDGDFTSFSSGGGFNSEYSSQDRFYETLY